MEYENTPERETTVIIYLTNQDTQSLKFNSITPLDSRSKACGKDGGKVGSII